MNIEEDQKEHMKYNDQPNPMDLEAPEKSSPLMRTTTMPRHLDKDDNSDQKNKEIMKCPFNIKRSNTKNLMPKSILKNKGDSNRECQDSGSSKSVASSFKRSVSFNRKKTTVHEYEKLDDDDDFY